MAIEERLRAVLTGAVLAILALGGLVLAFSPSPPAHCAAVKGVFDEAALEAAIDDRAAEIRRAWPDAQVDRVTLQLDLMVRCAD